MNFYNMTEKFQVQFLEEAAKFLDSLDERARDKVIYNIQKARLSNDRELFKKLKDKSGNSGLCLTEPIIGFLPFGTRQDKQKLL